MTAAVWQAHTVCQVEKAGHRGVLESALLHEEETCDDPPLKAALYRRDFALSPGMVLGTVDVVCCGCGETNSRNCNTDGSNAYGCPHCGMRNGTLARRRGVELWQFGGWLSSENRPITRGCQKAGVDRTASLGETWVQFNAMPVELYPAGVARYRVPWKY